MGPKQWIIARSLCLYRIFVLGDIPSGERKSALNLRIRQWSPFPETGRYVVWNGESAHVWIWDEVEQREAARKSGATSRVFPETVMRGAPDRDTLRILSCTEGIEAQIWRQGRLAASRWWAEGPPHEEWPRFLAAHDLNPNTDIPEPEDTPLLDRPWGQSADGNPLLNLGIQRLCVFAVMAVLTFVLIWQGISVWRWQQAQGALADRIAALTEEAEPLLEARTRATRDRKVAERLLSLVSHPAQLELMAAVAEKLPRRKVFLAEWHYNQGNLSFTLEGKNPDPRYYVGTYQKMPHFKEVTAERGREQSQLVVRMKVKEGL